MRAEEILKNTKDVDFVVNGEGEAVLLELVNTLNLSSTLIGDSRNNNFGAIPGISYRDGDKLSTIIQKIYRQFRQPSIPRQGNVVRIGYVYFGRYGIVNGESRLPVQLLLLRNTDMDEKGTVSFFNKYFGRNQVRASALRDPSVYI